MPIGFLTTADRLRLNRFPEQIPDEDLSAFFLLSEADQQAINQQHSEAHTRLGFALQLCALRYLGFAPDDLMTAPRAVEYIAQQLGAAPQALTAYGTRRPTRTTDFQHVQAYLHFRLATRWICMRCKRG
jgi:TnpA family transposase